jgi:hypothetical protein
MLTAEEFSERMERVSQRIVSLAAQPDDPAACAAADLLRTVSELHAAGLQRMLALINAGGDVYRPLCERFAQDDLIRSLLLLHDLHPIDLKTRLAETVGNLRPVVESYGGRVSIAAIMRDSVTIRLEIPETTGPSPVGMLQELLRQAIVVVAPDAGEIRFDDRPAPLAIAWELPVIQV